jgi:hypothetical protein
MARPWLDRGLKRGDRRVDQNGGGLATKIVRIG